MKIALVDGFNLAFRAFYGMPGLTRADGFPTGALHGWIRTLWYIEDNLKPDRMIVFFDLDGASRQTDLHADYKANRSDTPPDLVLQMPYIKRLTRAMGYAGVEKSGVEADDLIAAHADFWRKKGDEVMVVSADKDLAQLVKPGVTQWSPPPTANPKLGWRCLDEAAVMEKFGVPPCRIPDYLAIIGDTSDNIPGLEGVGPKTAVKWLQRYGSMAAVIDYCGELQPKRFQSVVHLRQDDLRRNLKMTTLDANHAVSDADATATAKPDELIALLEELEMRTAARDAQKRLS
jgi:DNA polymerase I